MENFISIIIPLYNGQKFIEETLASIVAQSFQNIELIVIDDGSLDDSFSVVENYCKQHDSKILKNIKLIKKENGGVASARNTGIQHANGSWLLFLDQDDILTPAFLEKHVSAMSENIKWQYCAFIRFYDSGKKIIKENGANNSIDTLKKLINGTLFIPPACALISKEALTEVGQFNSEFIPSDEWDFFIRLAMKYQPKYLAEPLVLFRSHLSSTGKQQRLKIFSKQLKVLETHFNALEKLIGTRAFNIRQANILWHIAREHMLINEKTTALNYYVKAIKKNPWRIKLYSSWFLAKFCGKVL